MTEARIRTTLTLLETAIRDSIRQFFRNIQSLSPQIIPVLADLAALSPDFPVPAGGRGIIAERLERRYLRIRFVQRELSRLDFGKARPGAAFGDFVFAQADFSAYRDISAVEFALFSGPGLDDYGDDFFERSFGLSRKTAAEIISGAYTEVPGEDGGRTFRVKDGKFLRNPLFLSIMRTLHTSLDFRPLFSREELYDECAVLFRILEAALSREVFSSPEREFDRLFYHLLLALDGGGMVHGDGMKTELSAHTGDGLSVILRGTFHPDNKPYTITLVS